MRLMLLAGLFLTAYAAPAAAYIGPGVGAGAIAVVLGVIASVFLALFAILWYPFKRMLKRRKAPAGGPDSR
jgi:hypothetical protein